MDYLSSAQECQRLAQECQQNATQADTALAYDFTQLKLQFEKMHESFTSQENNKRKRDNYKNFIIIEELNYQAEFAKYKSEKYSLTAQLLEQKKAPTELIQKNNKFSEAERTFKVQCECKVREHCNLAKETYADIYRELEDYLKNENCTQTDCNSIRNLITNYLSQENGRYTHLLNLLQSKCPI